MQDTQLLTNYCYIHIEKDTHRNAWRCSRCLSTISYELLILVVLQVNRCKVHWRTDAVAKTTAETQTVRQYSVHTYIPRLYFYKKIQKVLLLYLFCGKSQIIVLLLCFFLFFENFVCLQMSLYYNKQWIIACRKIVIRILLMGKAWNLFQIYCSINQKVLKVKVLVRCEIFKVLCL